MKYKYIFPVLAYFCVVSASAEVTFYETFDGYKEGSKAKDNIVDAGIPPVLWSDEAYTSIVSIDALKNKPGLRNIKEFKNPKILTNSVARSGTTATGLLFTYRAGPNSWSEQRFHINPSVLQQQSIKGLKEIWVQYDIFIPSNYRIVDDNPSSTNYFGAGHKVFTLYADGYSAPNTTFILGGVIARKDSSGKPSYDDNVYQMSTLSTYIEGERIFTQIGIDEKNRQIMWINADKDLGTWQRRTMHFKFPTAAGINDGLIEFWIKRDDSSIMKVIDLVSGTFFSPTQNYFNAGYINGFYNAGFPEETFLVVDNFILSSNESAIDASAISHNPRPDVPANVKVSR